LFKICHPDVLYAENRPLFDEFIVPLLQGKPYTQVDFRSASLAQSSEPLPRYRETIAAHSIAGGDTFTYTLTLDASAADPAFGLIITDPTITATLPISLTVLDPSGADITTGTADYAEIPLIQAGYAMTGTAEGDWTFILTATEALSQPVPFTLRAAYETPIVIEASTPRSVVQPNEDIPVLVQVYGVTEPTSVIATVNINYGNREVTRVTLYDDGQHDDGAAGDGLYGGMLPAIGLAGDYVIETTMDADGIQRTSRTDIAVSHQQAMLGERTDLRSNRGQATPSTVPSDPQAATSIANTTASEVLTLTTPISVHMRGEYLIIAELANMHGQPVSYARVEQVFETGAHTVNLVFEGKALFDPSHGTLTVRSIQMFSNTGEYRLVDEYLDVYQLSIARTVYLPFVYR
jgi:hypothetical protein